MSNIFRMKKSIATICVLLLATVLAVLVSTTQASSDAVTVLVYAPNSADVVANLEDIATNQNEQIKFLFADSWEAAQEQIESATTLVVDGDTLTTVDIDALRSTFIDSPLTVVGLDVEDGALASILGIEHVYYALSHSEETESPEGASYHAYYFDIEGGATDIATYFDAPTLDRSVAGVENRLQIHTVALNDTLDDDEQYLQLIQKIDQLASTETQISEPTAVSLTNVDSSLVSKALVIVLSVMLLGFATFKYGGIVRNVSLSILALGVGIGLVNHVSASSSKLDTVHYYVNTQTSTHNETSNVIESQTSYWSDQLTANEVIDSDQMVKRTTTQLLNEGDDTQIVFDSPTSYCRRSLAFYLGCNEGVLEADVDTRAAFGFNTDIDHIKSLYDSDDHVFDSDAGIAFSIPESQEFITRLGLSADVDQIIQAFSGEQYHVFGGIYIDHASGSDDFSAGGHIVVQVVEDSQIDGNEHLESVIPELSYPERIQIETVQFSERYLTDMYDEIGQLESYRELITLHALDTANNSVEVAIVSSNGESPQAEQRTKQSILSQLPMEYREILSRPGIVFYEQPRIMLDSQTTAEPGTAFEITDGVQTGPCTIGFHVKRYNKSHVLTAGHCVNGSLMNMGNGAEAQVGGKRIGEVVKWLNGSVNSNHAIDAALIEIDRGITVKDIVDYGGSDKTLSGRSLARTGSTVCVAGRYNNSCGTVKCTYATISNFRLSTAEGMTTQGGDSGAPVMKKISPHHHAPSQYYASGIHNHNAGSGITTSTCIKPGDKTFTRFTSIMWEWDVELER